MAQAADYSFNLAVVVLVLVAAWAAAPAIVGRWLIGTVFGGLIVLWVVTQRRMRAYAPSDEAPEEDEARGVRAGRTLWNLRMWAVGAFAIASLVWNAWHWQPVAGAILAVLFWLFVMKRG